MHRVLVAHMFQFVVRRDGHQVCQVQIVCMPQIDHQRPGFVVVALRGYPFVLFVSRKDQIIAHLGKHKSRMIVGRRID